jgi:hypothetical protein
LNVVTFPAVSFEGRAAAMSFMRWQADRGVLDLLDLPPPGSA